MKSAHGGDKEMPEWCHNQPNNGTSETICPILKRERGGGGGGT